VAKILAIVITKDASKWVSFCFRSLVDSHVYIEVVNFDNDSKDGTQDIIGKLFPSIEVVRLAENIGFGKANNLGLKHALEGNFDYAFLLNQDAWIEPDTIGQLIAIHRNNSGYGILSPLHFSGDTVNLDRNFSSYINEFSCPGLMSDAFSRRKFKDVYEINFVNAAMWLISRNVLEKVGGFDPLFFMYGEDDDYVRRARYHGFKIGICPSVKGYHDRPQNIVKSSKWSADRLFSSKLITLKDPEKPLPPKQYFIRTLIKSKMKSILFHEDLKKSLQINKRIITNYEQINTNRRICQFPNPTFLNGK
jgi:GT2 family glycosyltransferase